MQWFNNIPTWCSDFKISISLFYILSFFTFLKTIAGFGNLVCVMSWWDWAIYYQTYFTFALQINAVAGVLILNNLALLCTIIRVEKQSFEWFWKY